MTPLAAALLLSLVHLGAGRLESLRAVPRSRLLSFASGVCVAFVFLHLLPLVAQGQGQLGPSPAADGARDRTVWLFALAGLATFHGLELMVVRARRPSRALADGSAASGLMYWLHIAIFATYNALVGYLLVPSLGSRAIDPLLFVVPLMLHFLVNDIGLRTHYKRQHGAVGQWILALAPPFGWAMSRGSDLTDLSLTVLLAFLAGAVMVNTLKEELPDYRESRFWPFVLGGLLYWGLIAIV